MARTAVKKPETNDDVSEKQKKVVRKKVWLKYSIHPTKIKGFGEPGGVGSKEDHFGFEYEITRNGTLFTIMDEQFVRGEFNAGRISLEEPQTGKSSLQFAMSDEKLDPDKLMELSQIDLAALSMDRFGQKLSLNVDADSMIIQILSMDGQEDLADSLSNSNSVENELD